MTAVHSTCFRVFFSVFNFFHAFFIVIITMLLMPMPPLISSVQRSVSRRGAR